MLCRTGDAPLSTRQSEFVTDFVWRFCSLVEMQKVRRLEKIEQVTGSKSGLGQNIAQAGEFRQRISTK